MTIHPRGCASITKMFAALSVAALVGAVLGGCSSYQLKGHVIKGDVSWAAVVDASDPRLREPGLPGAQIALINDPMKINRQRIGAALSDANGDFAITVTEPGAGWMLYDVGAYVSRQGFLDAEGFFRLPAADKRVLVVLQTGRSEGKASSIGTESLIDEAESNWR